MLASWIFDVFLLFDLNTELLASVNTCRHYSHFKIYILIYTKHIYVSFNKLQCLLQSLAPFLL